MKLSVQSDRAHFSLRLPNLLLCTSLVYLALRKVQPLSYAAARTFCHGLRNMKKRQPHVPLLDVDTGDTHVSLKL